jgi:hypothetical protein
MDGFASLNLKCENDHHGKINNFEITNIEKTIDHIRDIRHIKTNTNPTMNVNGTSI